VSEEDAAVLWAVGCHLGSLVGRDLAARCREGTLDAAGQRDSRRERKRALTAGSSSRRAGAITRTTEDAWQLARHNLLAEAHSLRRRITRIQRRLRVPVGGREGRLRGYASRQERLEKQRRCQRLASRLAEVESQLEEGRVSVCRGGRRRARARHHLEEAGLSEAVWRESWQAARLFLTADGEVGKKWRNETIRSHPDEGWVELKLPAPLAHLANRPHGRYRLGCAVSFAHRDDEVAAQAHSGAVRYDLSFCPDKKRWYLDASWKLRARRLPALADMRAGRVLAVDVNVGHLAAVIADSSHKTRRAKPGPPGDQVAQDRSEPPQSEAQSRSVCRDGKQERVRAAP
jgi:hypothetical protein